MVIGQKVKHIESGVEFIVTGVHNTIIRGKKINKKDWHFDNFSPHGISSIVTSIKAVELI